jgi:hypothetical protein
MKEGKKGRNGGTDAKERRNEGTKRVKLEEGGMEGVEGMTPYPPRPTV